MARQGRGKMKSLQQVTSITGAVAVGAVAIATIYWNFVSDTSTVARPEKVVALSVTAASSDSAPPSATPSATPDTLAEREPVLEQTPEFEVRGKGPARLDEPANDHPCPSVVAKQDFSYLGYYAYAEILPDRKPADTVLETMKGVPVGTPVEEIKRASEAFGLDFVFMRAVAKIESDFDPKQK